MKSQEVTRIKRLTAVLAAVLTCLTASCGAQNGYSRMGVDGYVYSAEAMQDAGWNSAENFYVARGYLYYLSDSHTVKKTPLGGGDKAPDISKGEKVLALSALSAASSSGLFSTSSIADYAVDQEGNICYVAASYTGIRTDWGMTTECAGGTLYKQTPDGGLAYQLELPEEDGVTYGPDCLALDGKGNAYVLSGASIFKVDGDGRLEESLGLEPTDAFGKVQLLEGSGGQVFYYIREFGPRIRGDAFLINGEEDLRLDAVPALSERAGVGLYKGLGGPLKSYGGRLYQYDGESLAEILRWGDSDILDKDVKEIAQIDADHYIVATKTADAGRGPTMLLSKTALADRPQKEVILLASLYPSDALKQSVLDFNRSSDKYHVTIESYGWDFYGGDANEDAYLRLDSSLVSKNGPDILDLAEVEAYKYAENGVLEDLSPYMKDGSVVRRENYLDNVLDGYTIGGRLIGIPTSFEFISWAGVTPEARILEEWTMPGIMDLTEKYPDTKLFGAYYLDSSDFLLGQFCSPYYLERFVDWEEGNCSFDSEEFCRLLEWVKVQDGKKERPHDNELQENIIEREDMFEFESYSSFIVRHGEDVAVHGYPSVDGKGIYVPEVYGALGIISGSPHKEGAWEFLQYFLSQDDYGRRGYPTRLDLLDEQYEKEIDVQKRGSVYYDANGNRIEYKLEKEQADTLMRILESIDFTPRNSAEEGIVKIVLDEAAYLLDGSKTAKEVCGVIQNRAKLLLKEL